jgi:beta-lactam-binding protein with PASTA domain
MYLLETAGLKVQAVGSGNVVRQSIAAGEMISKGTQISIELR